MIDIKISGGKEIYARLQQIPVEYETKLMRNALARGAKVIKEEAILRAPIETGDLRDAIKTTRDTNRRTGQVIAKVKLLGEHSYIGHFMEYGVLPHIIGDEGQLLRVGEGFARGPIQHPGHSEHPFMRPALDSAGPEAVQVISKYLRDNLFWASKSVPDERVDVEG